MGLNPLLVVVAAGGINREAEGKEEGGGTQYEFLS